MPLPLDAREELLEQKRQALWALRELQFEHEAGHVSDDDYAELAARYEAEAARVLTELDRIGPAVWSVGTAAMPSAARGWRHPLVVTSGAVCQVDPPAEPGAEGDDRLTEPESEGDDPAVSRLTPAPSPRPSPRGRGRLSTRTDIMMYGFG